jgi:hypothetical protein
VNRAAAYATSRKNLVGSALGLVGVALALTGVIPGALPALGAVAALYAAGALLMPERHATLPDGADEPIDVDSIRRNLKRVAGAVGGTPPDVAAKTTAIITQLQDLLPRLSQQSASSDEVYVISRLASDYLPETLDAYLKLPRQYAETHVLSGGQTAHQMVVAQLDLLSQKATEVTNAILKGDGDALAAQGRFLAERFARSSLQLRGPGTDS